MTATDHAPGEPADRETAFAEWNKVRPAAGIQDAWNAAWAAAERRTREWAAEYLREEMAKAEKEAALIPDKRYRKSAIYRASIVSPVVAALADALAAGPGGTEGN